MRGLEPLTAPVIPPRPSPLNRFHKWWMPSWHVRRAGVSWCWPPSSPNARVSTSNYSNLCERKGSPASGWLPRVRKVRPCMNSMRSLPWPELVGTRLMWWSIASRPVQQQRSGWPSHSRPRCASPKVERSLSISIRQTRPIRAPKSLSQTGLRARSVAGPYLGWNPACFRSITPRVPVRVATASAR